MPILKISNLSVIIDNKEIIKDFDLTINPGEIHAIMGPNGTGKSTLTKIIMGDPNYQIRKGDITFDGQSIKDLTPDLRSKLGIFLGLQLPLEIEGVTNADFLRSAIHEREKENFKLMNFVKEMNQVLEQLEMNKDMIHRGINVGFSGGERKKNEILQMFLLKPNTILLDEIDSGLDVDSLELIGHAISKYYELYHPSILLITHYERLLKYIKPHFVHIMIDGKIIETGDASLVKKIDQQGYHQKSTLSRTCIVKELIENE